MNHPNNSRNIAERKYAGSYTNNNSGAPHIEEAQILGGRRSVRGERPSDEELPVGFPQVVTATPIGVLGSDTGSRMSAITTATGIAPDYHDDNPYHEENRRTTRMGGYQNDQRMTSGHESHGSGRYQNDQRMTSPGYESHGLTDLHGPHGTRGTEGRKMNNDQYTGLIKEGYSTGLALALSENTARYDFRFWVVDNSGSMQIGDGHRIVNNGAKSKTVACTRWEEIKETVKYHAQMATVLDCPTIFQLLNDPGLRTTPQKFSVCEHGEAYASTEVAKAIDIMRKISPSGVTPLTQHIWGVQEQITDMAAELRRSGKIVALILATDGLPTDEQGYGGEEITNEFIGALRALEGLPVWTVIRLCTDEEAVKDFYNSLDSQLEISIEVLDDYMGEAKEVKKHNPWITYALPLHRCRELGYHDRLFDLIDERPLTAGEARNFCSFILGLDEDDLPDPGVDAAAFLKSVKIRLDRESLQWNPIKQKMTPWILTKELKKSFSSRKFFFL